MSAPRPTTPPVFATTPRPARPPGTARPRSSPAAPPTTVAAHPDGDGTRIDVRMVVAPSTGTFRPGPVAEVTAEGEVVRPGDVLGHVEGSGRHQPIESFCHGFLVRLMVETGERVRLGQPVAWVHPFDGPGAGA